VAPYTHSYTDCIWAQIEDASGAVRISGNRAHPDDAGHLSNVFVRDQGLTDRGQKLQSACAQDKKSTLVANSN
jgi:hypothetical protein